MSRQDKEMEAAAREYATVRERVNGLDYREVDQKVAKDFKAGWKAASERKDETSAYHHEAMRLVAEAKLHLCELKLAQAEAVTTELESKFAKESDTVLFHFKKQRELEDKLATALEALEFYAEESNWEIDHDDCGNGYVREGSDYRPPGTRARAAIAAIKGEK